MRQNPSSIVLASFLSVSMAGSLWADIRAIVINENSLPYDLSPSNYDNSPSNYDNSSTNYDNSVSNYDNSPSNYDNSPSNYDNGIHGDRRVISEDNTFLGYYVFGSDGIINFYSASGERVGYIPGGGHTQSIFSENGWCGTMGQQQGRTVLGLTQSCFYKFLLNN